VVGPFFFVERTITGGIYLALLEQLVLPQADDIKIENSTGVVFQQDDALPYFRVQVCLTLNARFLNLLIGTGGSIAWAPGSSDLTLLDIFMWGM
jgi:hypothetical protein